MIQSILRLFAALARIAPGEVGPAPNAFSFSFDSIDGEPLPLAAYAGHPMLIVNTASLCGFTCQYAALEHLWQSYRHRGLVLIGVPSNDFGGQEPGTAAEIKAFCQTTYGIDFPLTQKVDVVGYASHPLFGWLREQLGGDAGPRWNFFKYLIAPMAGRRLRPSTVEPDAPPITSAIERLLPAGS